MMANTAQMENNPNPGISGFQRNRRGSGTNNEETIRSRDSTNLTINDYLPPEILIKIFHYLDFADIEAARLCCTRWLAISNYPECASKRIFQITEGVLDNEHLAAKVIPATKIENLYLEDIEFGDVDELFEEIGPKIKVLTLKSVCISQDCLLTLTYFTNLQSLKVCDFELTYTLVEDVEYPRFDGLSQLKELELARNDSCVDKYLLACSLCTDFLKKLTLEFTKELEVDVLEILDKQAKILKFIDLLFNRDNDPDLDVSEWKRIASKLSLKEISLRADFSPDIVVEMVKNQKSLHSLNFEGLNMDDGHLTLIAQNIPQLEGIFLIRCQQVTDIGVGQLAKLSKLTVLGLLYCEKITTDGIRSMISQEATTRLQELHMRYLDNVEMDAVCYCAQKLQHLRVLNLRCSEKAVTDISVNEIFEYQRNLREICLDECQKLTDFGMLGHSSIRKLEKLERLSLNGCYKLSDETLSGISGPHLKFLDIRGCLRMTGRGISDLVKNCPAIEEIAFTYSAEMNEEVVDVLTKCLRRLRTLTIWGCSQELKQGTTNWKRTHFHHAIEEVILRRRT